MIANDTVAFKHSALVDGSGMHSMAEHAQLAEALRIARELEEVVARLARAIEMAKALSRPPADEGVPASRARWVCAAA